MLMEIFLCLKDYLGFVEKGIPTIIEGTNITEVERNVTKISNRKT